METVGGIFWVILIIVLTIGAIFLTRAIGAWMLRINDVIDNQSKVVGELREIKKFLKQDQKSE